MHPGGSLSEPGWRPDTQLSTSESPLLLLSMWVVVPNLAADSTYPTATQDSAGTPLESHLDDQLVFSTSGLPPIEETGFCSLTTYQDDQSIVDNNPRSNTYNLSGATDADQVYALGSVQLPGSKRSPLRLSLMLRRRSSVACFYPIRRKALPSMRCCTCTSRYQGIGAASLQSCNSFKR